MCGITVSEEFQSLIPVLLIVLPAALYGLGLMEGKWARPFFTAGLAAHLASFALRAVSLGWPAFSEKFDNISWMAFATAALYWHQTRGSVRPHLQLLAVPLTVLLILCAFFYPPVNALSPFMRSPWFFLHMALYCAAYGFFGISACFGISFLLGGGAGDEALQARTASHGWALFTLSLVAGSIWFFIAYGTYWLWTSRELFTTLTWFWFGLYLHQRYLPRLSGKAAAAVGIAGYLAALFAYFGVGTILPAPPVQF